MSSASPATLARPIRVLHVVGSMNMGGVETWLMNVLRNVSRDELAFDFAVHRTEIAAYDEELLTLGANRYVCKWPNNPLVYARNFLRILRDHGPYDVVHSHTHHFSGFVLLLAKLAGVPIRVAHSHSDTSAAQQKSSSARTAYLKGTERLISYAATSGIAVSEKAATSLFGSDWKNDGRWRIIYCGIDLKAFDVSFDKAKIRNSLGILEDDFVIGHVGRFSDAKNHRFLIDIFNEFKKINSNAVLLLVGEGELKDDIRNKAYELNLHNDVVFAGLRSDIPQIMKGAMDIFLFPSIFQGLGLALVEAQAAGLKCLASEAVPCEAKISDTCRFFPLSASPLDWAKQLIKLDGIATTNQEDLRKFDINQSI